MKTNNKFLALLFVIGIAFIFTACKKDDDTPEPEPEIDPIEYLWGKWWYNDIQANMYFNEDGTCNYFDDTFAGTWHWIEDTDTMQVYGAMPNLEWKQYLSYIKEDLCIFKYDADGFSEAFTFTLEP